MDNQSIVRPQSWLCDKCLWKTFPLVSLSFQTHTQIYTERERGIVHIYMDYMYFNEYDNYFRHDCDEVTKSFLREVYDVTDMPDLKSTGG